MWFRIWWHQLALLLLLGFVLGILGGEVWLYAH